MWNARNKTDLIIEVWEKLDCESVGAAEIEAIETAVEAAYGNSAVDSPMIVARLLADEGAELRHSEIMELFLRRASVRPYDAALEGLVKTTDLKAMLASIRNAENLRKKFQVDNDREGLRVLRNEVIADKNRLMDVASKATSSVEKRALANEMAEWLTLWLQSPELFETWLELRRKSADFAMKFGEL